MEFAPFPNSVQRENFVRNPHSLVAKSKFRWGDTKLQFNRFAVLYATMKHVGRLARDFLASIFMWRHPLRTLRFWSTLTFVAWVVPRLWPLVVCGSISLTILALHPEYPTMRKTLPPSVAKLLPVFRSLRAQGALETPFSDRRPLGRLELLAIYKRFASKDGFGKSELKKHNFDLKQNIKYYQNGIRNFISCSKMF